MGVVTTSSIPPASIKSDKSSRRNIHTTVPVLVSGNNRSKNHSTVAVLPSGNEQSEEKETFTIVIIVAVASVAILAVFGFIAFRFCEVKPPKETSGIQTVFKRYYTGIV